MGDIKRNASGKDPTVTKGKLKTTFKRVEGCKKLDRMVAHKNMEKVGVTQINKRKGGMKSFFALFWRDYI